MISVFNIWVKHFGSHISLEQFLMNIFLRNLFVNGTILTSSLYPVVQVSKIKHFLSYSTILFDLGFRKYNVIACIF
jgi:hypothetical protein